jgi:hypothetical protein
VLALLVACKQPMPPEYHGLPPGAAVPSCRDAGTRPGWREEIRMCVAAGQIYTCILSSDHHNYDCAQTSQPPMLERGK